jgi:hypothetical protein
MSRESISEKYDEVDRNDEQDSYIEKENKLERRPQSDEKRH